MESLEGSEAAYFAHELVFVDQDRLSSKLTKYEDLGIYYEGSRKAWSTTEFEQLIKRAKLPFIRRVIRALWQPKHAELTMILLRVMRHVDPLNYETRVRLGLIYFQLGFHRLAIKEFKILVADLKGCRGYYNIAICYKNLEYYELAYRYLVKAKV